MRFDRALTCLGGGPGLPVFAFRPGVDGAELSLDGLDGGQAAFLRSAGFTGAAGQVMLLPGADGLAGAAVGLGAERSMWAHGALPMALPAGSRWRLVAGDYDMDDAVLGWCLGAYQYGWLSRPARGPALLVLGDAGPHERALAMARATWLARDLINTPANLLGPRELAEATAGLAARFGATAVLVEGAALESGYPAIAAVGAGSERGPVVARFDWAGPGAGADAPLLSLCGKGVVFDTGGYDLKPSAAMLRMKKDMGGAALMLALASAVMAAGLPIRLEVRIGCVENSVSGRAMRPSDVIRTRKGLTVEIGNTDAEGRLVLCDLLAEACEGAAEGGGPALLIDAATLTGAARVALGPDIPAFMTNDEGVAGAFAAAGEDSHDPVWRLPLHSGYDSWLSSGVADLGNVAGKPMAGAIVAGLFLQRFVTLSRVSWLHLDTYAWNDSTRGGRPEGGEALGLRALCGMIASLKRFNIL